MLPIVGVVSDRCQLNVKLRLCALDFQRSAYAAQALRFRQNVAGSLWQICESSYLARCTQGAAWHERS